MLMVLLNDDGRGSWRKHYNDDVHDVDDDDYDDNDGDDDNILLNSITIRKS